MNAHGATDPLAPFAGSSIENLLAFSLGADRAPAADGALPEIAIVEAGGLSYPALRFRVRKEATSIAFVTELSEDLQLWKSGAAQTIEVAPALDNGDGTLSRTFRSLHPLNTRPLQSLRLRVEHASPE
jgi:hypothetical protein